MNSFTYRAVTVNGVKGFIATLRINGYFAGRSFARTKAAARAAFDFTSEVSQ